MYFYDSASKEIIDKDLFHYGTPKHSGRYPYGSGENPYQGEMKKKNKLLNKKYKVDKKIRKALESELYTKQEDYYNSAKNLQKYIKENKREYKKSKNKRDTSFQEREYNMNKFMADQAYKDLSEKVEAMKKQYTNKKIKDIKQSELKIGRQVVMRAVYKLNKKTYTPRKYNKLLKKSQKIQNKIDKLNLGV